MCRMLFRHVYMYALELAYFFHISTRINSGMQLLISRVYHLSIIYLNIDDENINVL